MGTDDNMEWAVTARGLTFIVFTRDRIDWADDWSNKTHVTGATASIAGSETPLHSREIAVSKAAWDEDRETTHARAVKLLMIDNGLARVEEGEVKGGYTATKVR